MKILNLIFIVLIILFFPIACNNSKTKKTMEQKNTEKEEAFPNGEVIYSADSMNMVGYFASKAKRGSKVPGILVIHEWWGHNNYARMRADMLAELGYVAFAIDMYGDGKNAKHPDDAAKFSNAVFQDLEQSKMKFIAAVDKLKSHPLVDENKIGAIGYCFGGTVAMNMANAGINLGAVAAFHSSLSFPILADSTLKTKILVCNGADDGFISEESVINFKIMMDNANVDYKYVVYPGAAHSFTSKEADENAKKFNLPLAYHAEADSASWEEMKILFAKVF